MGKTATEPKQSVARLLLMVVIMPLLGLLVAWWSYADKDWLPGELGTYGWIFWIINISLVVGVIVFGLFKRIDWLEPIYFVTALFALIFVVRPLQIAYAPSQRSPYLSGDPELIQWTLLLGMVGFVSLLMGYALKAGERIGRRLPVFSGKWNISRLLLITVVYIVVGLSGYIYAIAASGGIRLFLDTLQGRHLLSASSNWVFASTLILLHVATLLLAAYFAKFGRQAFLLLTTLLLATGSSLLLGGRSDALITILAAVAIFYYVRFYRRRHVILQTPVIIVTSITLFLMVVIVGNLRVQAFLGSNIFEADILAILFSGEATGQFLREFSQFDWFAIVLDVVPETLPFQLGQSFLHFFAMFIPSALWPDKPVPIAFLLNRTAGGPGFGSPPSIIGELYINFSVPGIIAGMFLFGVAARALYAYLRANPQNIAVITLYAYSFASIHRFFTRSFAPKLFGYVLFIVPLLVALWFIQERPKRAVGRAD